MMRSSQFKGNGIGWSSTPCEGTLAADTVLLAATGSSRARSMGVLRVVGRGPGAGPGRQQQLHGHQAGQPGLRQSGPTGRPAPPASQAASDGAAGPPLRSSAPGIGAGLADQLQSLENLRLSCSCGGGWSCEAVKWAMCGAGGRSGRQHSRLTADQAASVHREGPSLSRACGNQAGQCRVSPHSQPVSKEQHSLIKLSQPLCQARKLHRSLESISVCTIPVCTIPVCITPQFSKQPAVVPSTEAAQSGAHCTGMDTLVLHFSAVSRQT
ncbi:hypothetical protein HaLaN_11417 [Haematococcus lacustris]|uniref:Uncharacterized protein n=1 Tax=Haematococcus lacustris TaxID=44745 RepID=A0A699Z129_HAELA|nr:hypothetical protein HaLaN_11417 [Haematococcus lacustris]